VSKSPAYDDTSALGACDPIFFSFSFWLLYVLGRVIRSWPASSDVYQARPRLRWHRMDFVAWRTRKIKGRQSLQNKKRVIAAFEVDDESTYSGSWATKTIVRNGSRLETDVYGFNSRCRRRRRRVESVWMPFDPIGEVTSSDWSSQEGTPTFSTLSFKGSSSIRIFLLFLFVKRLFLLNAGDPMMVFH